MPRILCAALAALLFSLPLIARAQDVFGDCSAGPYMADFGSGLTRDGEPVDVHTADVICSEFFRLPIGNGSFIRGLLICARVGRSRILSLPMSNAGRNWPSPRCAPWGSPMSAI